MEYALFALAVVVLGIIGHALHLERGTPDGATAPDRDQHRLTGIGWAFCIVALIMGGFVGSLPALHTNVYRPLLEKMGVKYEATPATGGTVTVTASSGSASASVTISTRAADPDAEKLLNDNVGKIVWTAADKKITFPDLGAGWQWFVVDLPHTTGAGTPVVGLTYSVQATTVSPVQVYVGKEDPVGTWKTSRHRPVASK